MKPVTPNPQPDESGQESPAILLLGVGPSFRCESRMERAICPLIHMKFFCITHHLGYFSYGYPASSSICSRYCLRCLRALPFLIPEGERTVIPNIVLSDRIRMHIAISETYSAAPTIATTKSISAHQP